MARKNSRIETEIRSVIMDAVERLKNLRPVLTPEQEANAMMLMREMCLARAHEIVSADAPLDDQAWRSVSIAGQLQDQIHKQAEHKARMSREAAGLDGRIEFVFSDGSPIGRDYAEPGQRQ